LVIELIINLYKENTTKQRFKNQQKKKEKKICTIYARKGREVSESESESESERKLVD